MNCKELHREAVKTLRVALLLRSPLPRVVRNYLLRFADGIDSLHWAPDLVLVEKKYLLSSYLPPSGWTWGPAYIIGAKHRLYPEEIENTRRHIRKW